MRCDPAAGFDAEACAAIAATLPASADADAVLDQLAQGAGIYLSSRRDPAKQRDRLAHRLKLIEEISADLSQERCHPIVVTDGSWPRRALEALMDMRRMTEWAHHAYATLVRVRARRVNPPLDLLYFSILKAWIDAGGKLGISVHPKTRVAYGPVVTYMRTVVLAITSKAPSPSTVRRVVKRWEKVLMLI